MQGLPIPAIFICDAGTDFSSLSKRYNVLDGRQRLESIFEFLENRFRYNNKLFNEFDEDDKKRVLNYNVTLIQMYLEPDDTDRIKEIFKRLNKNSYNLNRMEKQSTQLVEYDYMIIAKIVAGLIKFENIESYLHEIHDLFESEDEIEEELEVSEYIDVQEEADNIPTDIKKICVQDNIHYINRLLTSDLIFSAYDKQRQITLQYFLNIFSCILKDEIINRNVTEKNIIDLSNVKKEIIEQKLIQCNKASEILIELYEDTKLDGFWKNKASFFTLCYMMTTNLSSFKGKNIEDIVDTLNNFKESSVSEWNDYYEASNQGVNDKKQREIRDNILAKRLISK